MRRTLVALLCAACAPKKPPRPAEGVAGEQKVVTSSIGYVLGGSPGFAGGKKDRLYALDLDAKGRVVAAGASEDASGREWGLLVRYLPDGKPDPTFGGGDGVQLTEAGEHFQAVRVLESGAIVAAGFTAEGKSRTALLARFRDDGAIDPAFGEGGRAAVTRFSGYSGWRTEPSDRFNALDLDARGRIVVAGAASELKRDWFYRTLVARYTPDGKLDATFGGTGFVAGGPGGKSWWTGVHDDLLAVRVTPAGRILAAGWVASPKYEERTLIVAYDDAGRPDGGFAGTGWVRGPERSAAGGVKEVFYGLTLDGEGRAVASGFSFDDAKHIAALLVRYAPDGKLDPLFGDGGVVVEAPRALGGSDIEYLTAVRAGPRGGLVAAGFTDDHWAYGDTVDRALLARYGPTGKRESAFVSWRDGRSIYTGGTDDGFFAVALDRDENAWAAGTSGGRTLLARFPKE